MRPDPQWPTADVWLATESESPALQVVGVPNSRASLTESGADLAPMLVRHRLSRFSTFHGEMDVDFGDLPVRDLGNWPVSEIDPVPLIGDLTRRASELTEADLTVFIGGDNAITRPLAASAGPDPGKVGLITFDAHHDVRALENGPSNGNPIRGLVEEHGLLGRNVVQIGIQSFSNSAMYRRYADELGITTVTVEQLTQIGMKAAVDVALAQLSSTCDVIYVDVDLDVLDRVHAPGCPGSRPGGLGIRELAHGVLRCASHPFVRAMDFVEFDPSLDRDHQTADVMAHLILSAAAGLQTRRSGD